MSLISLDPNDRLPLIEQIVSAVQRRIDERALRGGTRMPSIRQFALEHHISRFTVVQAYDRLVAMGYLRSQPGSGFYVAARATPSDVGVSGVRLERAMDVLWLLRNALHTSPTAHLPGAGWLPSGWLDEAGLQRSLRELSRKSGDFLTVYGTPHGYLPLRQLLQHRLAEAGIAADETQIVTTRGVSHALDLIARYLIKPGDAVLVDEPGYFILFGMLKSLGAKLVGVPWTQQGPDITLLETIIQEHRPVAFFTNTVLHNPTGASISQGVAHRVLQLAEKYDFYLVEDDIYGDFHPGAHTRLATLDQLHRVIYVSSFSKTVSATLRVGFLACKRELAEQLTDLKLLTGLTSSEINERLMHQLLIAGYYRKHLEKLRARLAESRQRLARQLEKLNFELYAEPAGGIFMWARHNAWQDTAALASDAAQHGIILAPGNLFHPHQAPSPWLRFNVASTDQAVIDFLAGRIKKPQH